MLAKAGYFILVLLVLSGCVQTGYQPVYIISQTPAEDAKEEPKSDKDDFR